MLRVLVVGHGGREHALVKALQGPGVEVHALPGSEGMMPMAQCHKLPMGQALQVCQEQNIDLVLIGPEQPLVDGLYDKLKDAGVAVIGCSARAAQLEGSKVFAKEFMKRAGVPTARSEVVRSVEELKKAAPNFKPPYVLKADGLAAGKGVFLLDTLEELFATGKELFEDKILGASGDQALLEEFAPGYELSLFVLTNGEDYQILPLAQDHKRLGDGQTGPNTGGMGAVAPMAVEQGLLQQIEQQIVRPTVHQLSVEKLDYRGVVFIGLMVTERGPLVLEYNVRFGDPEAQVLLPLLKGSWSEVFQKLSQGELAPLSWEDQFATCVVLAAPGYPEAPQKGVPINFESSKEDSQSYFLHAGTERLSSGEWVTSGGRVLNAVGVAATKKESIQRAYEQAKLVSWQGLQKRSDIGSGA